MSRASFDDHFQEMLLNDKDLGADIILRGVAADVAIQIKTRRKELKLGQADLATALETSQSRISQMEDPDYGKLTLNTLANVAFALKCDLQVKLIPSAGELTSPTSYLFSDEPGISHSNCSPNNNFVRVQSNAAVSPSLRTSFDRQQVHKVKFNEVA